MRIWAIWMVAVVMLFGLLIVVGCEAENDTDDEALGEQNEEVLPAEEHGDYPDGRYRGAFIDRADQQIGIQFHLEDNELYDISFRVLSHGGNDYLEPGYEGNEWNQEDLEALADQHKQLIEYLEGRDITDISDLYEPEIAAEDMEGSGEMVDTWTAATVRGTKIISAIRDGLNRGIY